MIAVDAAAVARGAAAGLLVAGPSLLAARLAGDRPGAVVTVLYLAAMGLAFALAGWVAGARRTDTPMAHGAAAALAVAVVVEAAALPLAAGSDEGIRWGAVAAIGLVAATTGVAGGLGAEWAHRRRRRGRPGSGPRLHSSG